MTTVLARFRRHDGGATAIEYALVAGFIAVAIAASVFVVGDNLNAFWQRLAAAIPVV